MTDHTKAAAIAHALATISELDPFDIARVEAFARTLKVDPEAPRIVVEYGEEGRGSYLVDGVEVASSPPCWETSMPDRDCVHGSLARSCPVCELEAEVRRLRGGVEHYYNRVHDLTGDDE